MAHAQQQAPLAARTQAPVNAQAHALRLAMPHAPARCAARTLGRAQSRHPARYNTRHITRHREKTAEIGQTAARNSRVDGVFIATIAGSRAGQKAIDLRHLLIERVENLPEASIGRWGRGLQSRSTALGRGISECHREITGHENAPGTTPRDFDQQPRPDTALEELARTSYRPSRPEAAILARLKNEH